MPDQPKKHGAGWRVRWYPRPGDRHTHILDAEPEGWRFYHWLVAQEDAVLRTDPRIVHGTWDSLRTTRGQQGSILTFREYFEMYLAVRPATEGSKDAQRTRIHRHAAPLLDMPIAAVERFHVDQIVVAMKVKGLAPSTMHNVLSILSCVFRAAWRARAVELNPFDVNPQTGQPALNTSRATGFDAKTNSRLRKPNQLYIPQAEWLKLIAAAEAMSTLKYYRGQPFQLVRQLDLLIETGMRIGEVLALRIRHCHLDGEDPFVEKEFSRRRDGTDGPTKTRRYDEVGLTPRLAAALRAFCEGRDAEAAVFRAPQRRGDLGWRYENWYQCRWKPLLTLAKEEFGFSQALDIYPHAVRMNTITWARESGAPTRDIQLHVGQRSERTTERYDLGGPGVRRAMRKAIAAWGESAN